MITFLKKAVTFFLLLFLAITSNAQVWDWGVSLGGRLEETSIKIGATNNGCIVAGNTNSPYITFNGDSAFSSGNFDFIIAKLTSNGQPDWIKRFGGSALDNINDMELDKSGNILMTGEYYSQPLLLGSTSLSNFGSGDIFVAKADSSGNILWAFRAGSSSAERGTCITTDSSGNVYVAGEFSDHNMPFGSIYLNGDAMRNIFVAKFDPDGNMQWAVSESAILYTYVNDITVSDMGEVSITGMFEGSQFVIGSTTLIGSGFYHYYIAHFDSTGYPEWANTNSDGAVNEGSSIVTDPDENIYVAGQFKWSDMIFGNDTLTPNDHSIDVFLLKYTSEGNICWVKRAGGPNGEIAKSLCYTQEGKLCIGGYYGGGPAIFDAYYLNNSGVNDVFVAQFDTSGNLQWAGSMNGSKDDYGISVASDRHMGLYVCGHFKSLLLPFGSMQITNHLVDSADIFIAHITGITGISTPSETLFPAQIYPNPFESVLEIETNGWLSTSSSKDCYIEFFNSSGQLIHKGRLQSNSDSHWTYNTSSLETGYYFIRVSCGNRQFTSEVFKR